jgi:hypothetical protein
LQLVLVRSNAPDAATILVTGSTIGVPGGGVAGMRIECQPLGSAIVTPAVPTRCAPADRPTAATRTSKLHDLIRASYGFAPGLHGMPLAV